MRDAIRNHTPDIHPSQVTAAPSGVRLDSMKVSDKAVDEYIDIYDRNYGVRLDRDEAEHMIRMLLRLYRPLYEWHYRQKHPASDSSS